MSTQRAEMSTEETLWIADRARKAIPPGRDRLQARLLVLAGVPVLFWTAWNALQYAQSWRASGKAYLTVALAVSILFGLTAWRLRAATPGAAICGALICFDITVLSGRPDGGSVFHSGLPCLVLLFLLTHVATRYRRTQKEAADPGTEKHGRNAAQVIANLGVAGIAPLLYHGKVHTQVSILAFATLQVPMLSALAEATADTVSSEIGQALGGMPRLVLNFRRVAPGTDGAISLIGTVAGIVSAIVLAIAAGPTLGINSHDMVQVAVAATAGLFFDSLLGATLEHQGRIGNDLVNFASTWFAVAVAFFLTPAVVG